MDGSYQAWNARDNLLAAAQMIESACAWAEKDEGVYDRLGEFNWEGISIPLDELATELRQAGEFIVARKNPWEETEHLCGYSVFMGEKDGCFHEGCWEERDEIAVAWAMKESAQSRLHNFKVEPDPEDAEPLDFSRGYDSAIDDLEHWVSMWNNYKNLSLGKGNMEEHARVATVVKNGGGFEDFITREIFFIREGGYPYPQTPEEARVCGHGNTYWFGHECGLCEEE